MVGAAWLLAAVDAGSRFLFTLDSSATAASPECFYELLDARATQNRLLFRFEIVDSDSLDIVDAYVQTPTGRIAESWDGSKAGHVAVQVYPGRVKTVGTESITSSALTARTTTVPESVGWMSFSFAGVSASILDEKTRVYLSLSVKTSTVPELQLAEVAPATMTNGEWQRQISTARILGRHLARCEAGSMVVFDITDIASDAIKHHQAMVSVAVFSPTEGAAELYAMAQVAADHWPLVTFEDVGTTLWIEMMRFQQRVWDLKGKSGFILQHERTSRNAAESANARLMYVAVLVNAILIGMGVAQVYYIQQWLNY
ncbi:hypothetical protein ACHHYP_10891 [Achlya hypogyna]|uniref:GOLD domain-containing protein n=1 Tax=Achlya hypogyna TaxID=1202772 RepID=A0A1V9ZHQ3_ACHHY|nr:hypothetical protein ACHHYP_10891 [Achlya hypogyna]